MDLRSVAGSATELLDLVGYVPIARPSPVPIARSEPGEARDDLRERMKSQEPHRSGCGCWDLGGGAARSVVVRAPS